MTEGFTTDAKEFTAGTDKKDDAYTVHKLICGKYVKWGERLIACADKLTRLKSEVKDTVTITELEPRIRVIQNDKFIQFEPIHSILKGSTRFRAALTHPPGTLFISPRIQYDVDSFGSGVSLSDMQRLVRNEARIDLNDFEGLTLARARLKL
jgi:hypothetical protein